MLSEPRLRASVLTLTRSLPQPALAQVRIEPGGVLLVQIGRRRRGAVVGLQVVAGIAIDLLQHLSKRKRNIGVGAAQRRRNGRQGALERARPDGNLGPALGAAEEDEVGRGGQNGGASIVPASFAPPGVSRSYTPTSGTTAKNLV